MMNAGIIAGYMVVIIIVLAIAGMAYAVVKNEQIQKPRPLPHTDFDIIQLPHTHNKLFRKKKACYACIQQFEIEAGIIEVFDRNEVNPFKKSLDALTVNELREQRGLGRGVPPPDDEGFILS